MTIESQIIPYQAEYFDDLKEVFQENTPHYFAPEEWPGLVNYLSVYADTYFVIKVEEKIVGAGGYHYTGQNTGRLSWFLIGKEHQGLGLGGKIVTHCLNIMENGREISHIEVWTSPYAEGFFKTFGFETLLHTKDYWAKGFDLVRMKRDLESRL